MKSNPCLYKWNKRGKGVVVVLYLTVHGMHNIPQNCLSIIFYVVSNECKMGVICM